MRRKSNWKIRFSLQEFRLHRVIYQVFWIVTQGVLVVV